MTGSASTDELTSLYNCQGFARESQHLLALLDSCTPCAMLLSIDVGYLNIIEHALGREIRDQLLVRVADILRGVFLGPAVMGRVGFDRFAVLILASPSTCTELIASLNEGIDAANLADPSIYLSLRGNYRLFDARHSDLNTFWVKRKTTGPTVRGVGGRC